MENTNTAGTGLEGRLKYVTDLRIPGYFSSVPPGSAGQLDFVQRNSRDWYRDFLAEIKSAIGNRFLPIYRMADGEFIFCVGRKAEYPPDNASIFTRFRFFVKMVFPSLLQFVRRQKPISQLERYEIAQRKRVETEVAIGKSEGGMKIYVDSLRTIAQHGMLALHFTKSPGRFSEQYIKPMCQWFESTDIPLNIKNYTAFYFIYALLCGPDAKEFFDNRRVLVVTFADVEKRMRIEKSLIAFGVHSVQFLQISQSQSLLDRLDLSRIEGDIDIAIVAAGIGSVNVLAQLEPLNTLCIDAGFCVEIFADDSKRGRIFTVPDGAVA